MRQRSFDPLTPHTYRPGGWRGQALVEFALVVPVFLGLMLVAVDFGRLFFSYVAVNNAAREATFHAATNAAATAFDLSSYVADVRRAAERESNIQLQGGEGALAVSAPECFAPASGTIVDCHAASDFAGGIGNHVRVTASQAFSFYTPLIGDLLGGQVTLTATATGPVLNPADVTILPYATPTPEPTSTPTSSPGSSPTPTPTLPTTCVVPDFYHTYWNDIGALTVWHDEAGFTGTLTDDSDGKKIQSQTLVAGITVPCTSHMTVSNN